MTKNKNFYRFYFWAGLPLYWQFRMEVNMKTIGLIGGMSWESTVTYYRKINETVKRELGGLHSVKILLYSVDFDEIEKYQAGGQWDKSADMLSDIAKRLEKAGADFIVICTNTMHKVVPQVKEHISIPVLHRLGFLFGRKILICRSLIRHWFMRRRLHFCPLVNNLELFTGICDKSHGLWKTPVRPLLHVW